MKIIEKLNAYEEKIIITVIVKKHKDHKKTQEDIIMDKHLLSQRLEKCVKIKEINEKGEI